MRNLIRTTVIALATAAALAVVGLGPAHAQPVVDPGPETTTALPDGWWCRLAKLC